MTERTPGRTLGRARRENVPGGRLTRHVVRVSAVEEARLLARVGGDPRAIAALMVSAALSDSVETPGERREAMRELFGIRRDLSVLVARGEVSREELGPVVERIDGAIEGLSRAGV